jgi:cell division protein FtsI (penicillin-binding protein 3)
VILLGLGAVLIVGRLAQLMIFTPGRQPQDSISFPVVERGPILDRNGRILAISTRLDSLSAWVPSVVDARACAELLAPVLGLDAADVLRRLQESKGFLFIKRKISPTESEAVSALLREGKLPGFSLVPEFGRNYPEQTLASHVLGYVGVDNVGLDGAEYDLNEELSPPAVSKVGEETEVFGNQVFLTLDVNVQQVIERTAQKAFTENRADSVSILVMQAKSGEILGYCSIPNFDPNGFASYPAESLRNLPLTLAYEPGSVFKIFTLSSFLQLGGITPESTFFCGGVYEMPLPGGQSIQIRDLGGHGNVNASGILKYSCNVGAAMASETVDRDSFYQMLLNFGFGKPTGLPLPGESAGILAPPQRWSARSKATIAFGQEVSVSAVQVLQGATVFANRGLLLRPHIVKKIVSPQGLLLKEFAREPLREVLSPDVALEVLAMMETATGDGGTARRGRIEGVRIAAKTGTSQVRDPRTGRYSQTHYIASYLGLLPADDPEIITYVVIDYPRGEEYYGSQVAAPAFREVADWLVNYLDIPRAGSPVFEHPGTVQVSIPERLEVDTTMPDLLGLPKRALLPLFQLPGVSVRLQGEGYVTGQDPPPGTPLRQGMSITLTLQ